jgi:hypothetical protein
MVTARVLLPAASSSRYSFTITYLAWAAEASRYEGSDDHEGDNGLDRSGCVSHLALILFFLFKWCESFFVRRSNTASKKGNDSFNAGPLKRLWRDIQLGTSRYTSSMVLGTHRYNMFSVPLLSASDSPHWSPLLVPIGTNLTENYSTKNPSSRMALI